MKKSLIFASMAVAGAFALHADWTCQNWFKGVGDGASGSSTVLPSELNTDLDPDNGEWAAVKAPDAAEFAGTLSINDNNELVFDLDDGEHLDFTIGSTAPADTGTITDVEVTGVFTPLTGTLPENSTMNDRNAQVGFVVAINGDATNYCAWVGSGWVELTNAAVNAGANIEAETSLLVRFDYRSSTKYASFAILSGDPVVTNFLGNSVGTVALTISSDAVASNRVCGVSCYGSGTLAKADGGVGLGIADVNGVKYGSLQDAINNATSGDLVTVLKPTTETVNTKEGIEITDPNGNAAAATINVPENTTVAVLPTPTEINSGKSGSCSVPLQMNATEDQIVIDLGDVGVNKEVKSGTKRIVIDSETGRKSLTFDIQTKADIVTNVAPGGVSAKKLCHDETRLRNFLNTYVSETYNGAGSTTAALESALEAENETSHRPLWQSYVLGVAPSDKIAPVTAPADTNPSMITLAIPGINPTGDYNVSYKVDGKSAGTSNNAIQIDISASGTHSVAIELE